MPGLASISIDLDGLSHYAALHGLAPDVVTAEARALVHRVAVPRFAELVEGVRGRGTLFVIAGEVDSSARPPSCAHSKSSRARRASEAWSRSPSIPPS